MALGSWIISEITPERPIEGKNRTGAPKNANDGPQPMACWTCKGPDVPRLIAEWGEDGYFGAKWAKGGPEIVNVTVSTNFSTFFSASSCVKA